MGKYISMNIDYLESGSDDCPLLRITSFTDHEISSLVNQIEEMISGSIAEFKITGEKSLEIICKLHEENIGIIRDSSESFSLLLNENAWRIVSYNVALMHNETSGYVWLDDTSKISLLLSMDGSW